VNHFGKLDIAIANAGITLFGDFLEFDGNIRHKIHEWLSTNYTN